MNTLQAAISKCTTEGNVLFLPTEMLPNYAEVKRALLNAGGKYKRNSFVFPNDAKLYADRLMGGEKVNLKKEFQFFATPDKIADKLVELAEIQEFDNQDCDHVIGVLASRQVD